jgi:hypothetical protein
LTGRAPRAGGRPERRRASAPPSAPATEGEIARLTQASRSLPAGSWQHEEHDYVTNLLVTVLDLQMNNATVERSIKYFRDHRWDEVRTLDQLADVLDRFPDDKDGNLQLARYLWGNNHWTRAGRLRLLAAFLAEDHLRTQDELRAWARRSDYQKDFAGRVPGLGPAAYQSLLMRLGVDTVKPDVHVHRFVEDVLGRTLTDAELVRAVTEAARRLGRSARDLDGAIWEHGARGGPVTRH